MSFSENAVATPSETAASLALRGDAPNANIRTFSAQCAFFGAEIAERLKTAARIKRMPASTIDGIRVALTFDSRLSVSAEIHTFDRNGHVYTTRMQDAGSLKSVVGQINSQQLQTLGVSPVNYQQGVEKVRELSAALQSGINGGRA